MLLQLSLHVETQTATHNSQYDNSILTVTSPYSVFHSFDHLFGKKRKRVTDTDESITDTTE